MRIVQTFWTAGRDPLKYAFGWSHPEYNLMSWALSCLSLREHYDEVALYTDQEGYDVLINKLHLPYTEVNVVYDKNLCLPHHWAYAKIKTYSMQTKPFIHVDGDVYLPHPIPEDIANAPLIAQNREIGTHYYRSMIDRLLSYPEIILPEFVKKGLAEQSVASYNMGLFGGSDLDFIQRYCKEVEDFMNINGMNNLSERVSRIDCNVFFEQILFAVFADSERREVASLLGRPIQDKGYRACDFCGLRNYLGNQFFHILGGHKNDSAICRMVENLLIEKYSEYFINIANLFKDRHVRLDDNDFAEVLEQYKKSINAFSFIDTQPEFQNEYIIEINPYAEILFDDKGNSFIKLPSIESQWYENIPIKEFARNIIIILSNNGMKYANLKEKLDKTFSKTLKVKAEDLIREEMKYLLYYGVITANIINNN